MIAPTDHRARRQYTDRSLDGIQREASWRDRVEQDIDGSSTVLSNDGQVRQMNVHEHDGIAISSSLGPQFLASRCLDDPPFDIAVVIISKVSLIALGSILEAVRAANTALDTESYRCECFSIDGDCLAIGGGVSVGTRAISELRRAHLVLLLGDALPSPESKRKLSVEVRRLSRHGLPIGGIGVASVIMCEAGLMRDRSWSVPWELVEPFRELYPDVRINGRLYTISGSLLTCAGQASALDMMLEIFRCHWGYRLAAGIAQACLHPCARTGDIPQRWELRDSLGISNDAVVNAVRRMEENLEKPLLLAKLAARVGVSQRQLERYFRRYLGTAPGQFYLRLRLEAARRILRSTQLPIVQIALATGFVSASHFTKAYRMYFGKVPRRDRSLS